MFSEQYSKMLKAKKPRRPAGRGMKMGGKKPLPMSGWGKTGAASQGTKEPPEDQDADDKGGY